MLRHISYGWDSTWRSAIIANVTYVNKEGSTLLSCPGLVPVVEQFLSTAARQMNLGRPAEARVLVSKSLAVGSLAAQQIRLIEDMNFVDLAPTFHEVADQTPTQEMGARVSWAY